MTPLNDEMKPDSIENAYKLAHRGAILVDRSDIGFLQLTGATRLDLINRMSTQKVDNLKNGEGAATILTSDIGRIIDRLILYADQDVVYCLTGRNNGDNIARYLMRFVFFMDDFQIVDLSESKAILGVYGAKVRNVIGGLVEEAEGIKLHHWREVEINGIPVSVHRTDPVAGDGYLIICQVEHKVDILSHLQTSDFVPAGHDTFEYLRIESGRPLFGRELTLDYIPLEAGLRADISFNKGCYTGQEIIARMDSRGKLAKSLVRLVPGSSIQSGTELKAGEKNAGIITSFAQGPAGPQAMGYVKRAYLDGNTPLTAGGVPVVIVEKTGS
jgi:folate-binding protein YgfZ